MQRLIVVIIMVALLVWVSSTEARVDADLPKVVAEAKVIWQGKCNVYGVRVQCLLATNDTQKWFVLFNKDGIAYQAFLIEGARVRSYWIHGGLSI